MKGGEGAGVASSIAARRRRQQRRPDQCLFGSRGLPIWKAAFRVEIDIERPAQRCDATRQRAVTLAQPLLSLFYITPLHIGPTSSTNVRFAFYKYIALASKLLPFKPEMFMCS